MKPLKKADIQSIALARKSHKWICPASEDQAIERRWAHERKVNFRIGIDARLRFRIMGMAIHSDKLPHGADEGRDSD